MSEASPGGKGTEQPHNIAVAIAEVSERATLLVREEIELAKAEVTEKATKLVKGAVVGVVAGIFFLTALVFALVGCAWLLYYFLPGGEFTYFWGFFAMAAILVVLGVIAGLVAARAVKRGSPPMPSMAIEEARKIRETVSASPAPAPPPPPPVELAPDPVPAAAPEAVPELAPEPAVEQAPAAAVEDLPDFAVVEAPDPPGEGGTDPVVEAAPDSATDDGSEPDPGPEGES